MKSKTFTVLTRQAMRNLAPNGKLVEDGITFERLKNGDGLFTVNFRADRLRAHRCMGTQSERTTPHNAEEYIRKPKEDPKPDPPNLPKGRKTTPHYPDAAAKYLVKLAEVDGKDMVAKRRRLNLHL